MSDAVLKWLGGRDTGLSSKAIALTFLGHPPDRASTSYPHDSNDFGRCYRLIKLAPEARSAVDALGANHGPYWKALAAERDRLTALYETNEHGVYEAIQAIVHPVEDADTKVVRLGGGAVMRFGP